MIAERMLYKKAGKRRDEEAHHIFIRMGGCAGLWVARNFSGSSYWRFWWCFRKLNPSVMTKSDFRAKCWSNYGIIEASRKWVFLRGRLARGNGKEKINVRRSSWQTSELKGVSEYHPLPSHTQDLKWKGEVSYDTGLVTSCDRNRFW